MSCGLSRESESMSRRRNRKCPCEARGYLASGPTSTPPQLFWQDVWRDGQWSKWADAVAKRYRPWPKGLRADSLPWFDSPRSRARVDCGIQIKLKCSDRAILAERRSQQKKTVNDPSDHTTFFFCERLSASMARSLHLRFSLCTTSDSHPGPGGSRTAACCQPQAWRPSARSTLVTSLCMPQWKNVIGHSGAWFRSRDLWVMGPTR